MWAIRPYLFLKDCKNSAAVGTVLGLFLKEPAKSAGEVEPLKEPVEALKDIMVLPIMLALAFLADNTGSTMVRWNEPEPESKPPPATPFSFESALDVISLDWDGENLNDLNESELLPSSCSTGLGNALVIEKFFFDFEKLGMALTRMEVLKVAFIMSVPGNDDLFPVLCISSSNALSSPSCFSASNPWFSPTPIAFCIASACSFTIQQMFRDSVPVLAAIGDGLALTCSFTQFSLSARAPGPSVSNSEKLQQLPPYMSWTNGYSPALMAFRGILIVPQNVPISSP